jgi:hypothetical protein
LAVILEGVLIDPKPPDATGSFRVTRPAHLPVNV